MSEEPYLVVDFRKEWTRHPYVSFWGPNSSGYNWSVPRAGRYTAEELDASVGYHTRRRYVSSRRGYFGPWERFGVPLAALEAMTSAPDAEGRWSLDADGGPIVRNSAATRDLLRSLRYVPRPASGIAAAQADETEGLGLKGKSPVAEGQTP